MISMDNLIYPTPWSVAMVNLFEVNFVRQLIDDGIESRCSSVVRDSVPNVVQ